MSPLQALIREVRREVFGADEYEVAVDRLAEAGTARRPCSTPRSDRAAKQPSAKQEALTESLLLSGLGVHGRVEPSDREHKGLT